MRDAGRDDEEAIEGSGPRAAPAPASARRGLRTAIGVLVGAAAPLAALFLVVGRPGGAARAPREAPSAAPRAAGAEELRLLGAAAIGGAVGACTLAEAGAITAGALPLVLRCPGDERVRVDVLRRDPGGPSGVAATERLELFLVTGRAGAATPEAHAIAVGALAELVRRDESAPLPAGLLSFRDRAARTAPASSAARIHP